MTTTKSLQSEGKCGKMIAQAAIIGFYRNGPTYCAEPLPCKFHATKRAGFIGGSNKGEDGLSEVEKELAKVKPEDLHFYSLESDLREPWVSVPPHPLQMQGVQPERVQGHTRS